MGQGPAVVFLHGFGSSLDLWRSLMPDLARNHRVLALDLKGFGWTDRPRGDYSPSAQAELVWALLDARGIDRAALVGHSWGASVALAMALASPERTTRIAVYDGWVYEEQLSFLFRWARSYGVGESLITYNDENWARSQLAMGFHDARNVTPDMVKALRSRMSRPGASAAALATLRGMHFTKQQRLYPTLKKPALVLWGLQDSISAPAVGQRLAADLGGELVMFPRCGHFPMLEAAEASNATLKRFLQMDPL
jgi:pimeloyl-ACP methyl ester carboxylesterase